jgi:hypothetical protein
LSTFQKVDLIRRPDFEELGPITIDFTWGGFTGMVEMSFRADLRSGLQICAQV